MCRLNGAGLELNAAFFRPACCDHSALPATQRTPLGSGPLRGFDGRCGRREGDGCGVTNYQQSLGNNANYGTPDGPFGRRFGARFADIVDGRRVAVGVTNAAGKFTLGTNGPGDGAPPGTHKIAVVWVGPPAADNAGQEVIIDDPNLLPKPAVKIPDKYASAETSGLTQEIPAGGSESLKIDLK